MEKYDISKVENVFEAFDWGSNPRPAKILRSEHVGPDSQIFILSCDENDEVNYVLYAEDYVEKLDEVKQKIESLTQLEVVEFLKVKDSIADSEDPLSSYSAVHQLGSLVADLIFIARTKGAYTGIHLEDSLVHSGDLRRTITYRSPERERLDVFITSEMKGVSRAFVSKMIAEGKILVNGNTEKSGYKLRDGDNVLLNFDLQELSAIPDIDFSILYQDEDCMVLNKPAGILTHSKGKFNPEPTVASFMRYRVKGMEGDRAGIVHRLDRATSGVIITAKTPEALSALQKQFSTRNVKKTYYAVIEGEIDPPKARIEVPVERNARDPKTFRPGMGGKPAITDYEVVATGNGYSLVRLQPHTGRTHQLRVHLKYLGHPIVGDPIYGGAAYNRMLLHAEKLELTLPNRQRKVFEAPLPPEFQAILEA